MIGQHSVLKQGAVQAIVPHAISLLACVFSALPYNRQARMTELLCC